MPYCKKLTIYILRTQDLRLQDNKALKLALDQNLPILFITCLNLEGEWNRVWFEEHSWSQKRRVFRLQCLQDLDNRLRNYTSISKKPILRISLQDPVDLLNQIFHNQKKSDRWKIQNLVFPEEAGWYEQKQQNKVADLCLKNGVKFMPVWDQTMIDHNVFIRTIFDAEREDTHGFITPENIKLVKKISPFGGGYLMDKFGPDEKKRGSRYSTAETYLWSMGNLVKSFPFPENISKKTRNLYSEKKLFNEILENTDLSTGRRLKNVNLIMAHFCTKNFVGIKHFIGNNKNISYDLTRISIH